MNKRTFGAEGEASARDYLIGRGYRICAMNYRRAGGEIDIIARKQDVTAFVEVKRRTSDRFGRPAEAVTPAKQRHILRAALAYVQENGLEDSTLRFDVIEISGSEICHIEGAFDATGLWC